MDRINTLRAARFRFPLVYAMGGRAAMECAWSVGALDVSEDPARAVRIFRAGLNDSTQGPVLFDEEAAKLVMSAFAARGIDGMIDLEHLSLDDSAPHFDPDARGHYQLEIRSDAAGGAELWMVPRWNAEGTTRITERRQRYVSPYFAWAKTRDGQRRVTAIRNVALVANPATHGAQPLIAASARRSRRKISGLGPAERTLAMADDTTTEPSAGGMNTERLQTLMEAFGLAPDAPIGELTALLQSTLMELQGQPAPTEATPTEEASADPAADPAKEEDKPAAMAATARLLRLTDRKTFSESLNEVEKWRQSHIRLADRERKLADDRAAMEATERLTLVRELVAHGGEIPATAWKDSTQPEGRLALSDRLKSEPIASLRQRAAAWKAKGGKSPLRAPATPTGGALGLSAREIQLCAEKKIDQAKFAEHRAAIAARSSRPAAQEG